MAANGLGKIRSTSKHSDRHKGLLHTQKNQVKAP